MLTILSKIKRAEQIQKKVNMTVIEELKAKNVESEIIVEKANPRRHQEAEVLGISPGKLLLIDKAREAEPELKVEDLKNAPVKDIVKLIGENKKTQKPEEAQKAEKTEGKVGKKPKDRLTEKAKAVDKIKYKEKQKIKRNSLNGRKTKIKRIRIKAIKIIRAKRTAIG